MNAVGSKNDNLDNLNKALTPIWQIKPAEFPKDLPEETCMLIASVESGYEKIVRGFPDMPAKPPIFYKPISCP